MKTTTILLAMLTWIGFCGLPSIGLAKTEIHLFDFSGSLAECRPLLTKNLGQVNASIDDLDKNDRFLFFGYRSQGQPILLAAMAFPNKRGPKGRDIQATRETLRRQLREAIANLDERLQNSGGDTDIIGALNHVLIFAGDQAGTAGPIILHHYSDGIHTSRTGSFKADRYQDYLARLTEQLAAEQLVKPAGIDGLVWHGAVCLENMRVSLQDSAALQSSLRALWSSYLEKEMPSVQPLYLLSY